MTHLPIEPLSPGSPGAITMHQTRRDSFVFQPVRIRRVTCPLLSQ